MKRTRRRTALILSLAVWAACLLGCAGAAPVGEALLELVIMVGDVALKAAVTQLVTQTINDWVFNKNAPENNGQGDVVPNAFDPLRGTYNGKMDFVVKSTQNASIQVHTTVGKPAMVRASVNAPWQMAPEVKKELLALLPASPPTEPVTAQQNPPAVVALPAKGLLTLKSGTAIKKGAVAWVEVDDKRAAEWPVGTMEVQLLLNPGVHQVTVKSIYLGVHLPLIYDRQVTIVAGKPTIDNVLP